MADSRLIGEILKEQAGLSAEKLAEALDIQAERGGRLGEILLALKAIAPHDLVHALAAQFDLAVLEEIDTSKVDTELARRIPINFAKQHLVLPVGMSGDELLVAVADPLNVYVLDDLRLLAGRPVRAVLAAPQNIVEGINRLYDRVASEAESLVDDLEQAADLDSLAQELEEPQDLLDASDEAPIIKLVNSLLYQAVKERCSDIHIEPMEREISVRFRRDGILYEILRHPQEVPGLHSFARKNHGWP
jgi:general secretion pathway protein E